MYLHTVDNKTWGGIQFLVAHVTLEVPRLLVLDQDLLVVKVPVAVPAPGLQRLLLLASHPSYTVTVRLIV